MLKSEGVTGTGDLPSDPCGLFLAFAHDVEKLQTSQAFPGSEYSVGLINDAHSTGILYGRQGSLSGEITLIEGLQLVVGKPRTDVLLFDHEPGIVCLCEWVSGFNDSLELLQVSMSCIFGRV